MLLSKLCWIGEMYAIPKFIKKKIKKKVEFSIWKSGLDILDINAQLQYQNLNVIKDY